MAQQSDDNKIDSSQDDPKNVIHDAAAPVSASSLLELNQIYALIDSILPFEACLYYQVAPLSIDGSCLVMGTVDPEDLAAIEYVTKQLSYINYSIRFETIASDWHRDLLSQYLKHTAQTEQSEPSSRSAAEPPVFIESPIAADSASVQTLETAPDPSTIEHPAVSLAADDVISSEPEPVPPDVSSVSHKPAQPVFAPPQRVTDDQLQATLILEHIEELTATMPRDFTSHLVEEESAPTAEASPSSPISPQSEPLPPKVVHPPLSPDSPADSPASDESSQETAAPAAASRPVLESDAVLIPPEPVLPPSSESAAANDQYDDISRLLCALPPKVLMQALLEKVIGDGIGRLYFKRQATTNRILWSRNGVLEGLIEPVDDLVLQAVINEFKRFTHASSTPVTTPQQVESERTYNGQRVLLRFQLMPSDGGEQATLQVLRGAALEFYQQQQMDRLGRDALDAAEMLQQRLNAIRDRARNALDIPPASSDVLPTLMSMLKQLAAQVEEIEASYQTPDQS